MTKKEITAVYGRFLGESGLTHEERNVFNDAQSMIRWLRKQYDYEAEDETTKTMVMDLYFDAFWRAYLIVRKRKLNYYKASDGKWSRNLLREAEKMVKMLVQMEKVGNEETLKMVWFDIFLKYILPTMGKQDMPCLSMYIYELMHNKCEYAQGMAMTHHEWAKRYMACKSEEELDDVLKEREGKHNETKPVSKGTWITNSKLTSEMMTRAWLARANGDADTLQGLLDELDQLKESGFFDDRAIGRDGMHMYKAMHSVWTEYKDQAERGVIEELYPEEPKDVEGMIKVETPDVA